VALVIACAAGLAGCAGPAASPSANPTGVFWTQSPHGNQDERGSIGRATLAGSHVRGHLVATAKGAAGVAVGGGYLFWANSWTFTIGRAKLDGSKIHNRFVEERDIPLGVAVQGGHVYWTSTGLEEEHSAIVRARLDGSHVQRHYIRVSGAPIGLAVDGRHVYWTYRYMTRFNVFRYAIGRADLDGSHVRRRFIKVVNKIDGVAVNGRYVFWSSQGEHAIGRANLDGTGVEQRCLATPSRPLENVPEGLAADAGHVYWTNYPADTIARASLDGFSREERFIKVRGVPEGVAVSAGSEAATPPGSAGKCAHPPKPRLLFGPTDYDGGPYAEGWGEVAPPVVSNGGASASGTISRIHWRSWGGRVATARGRHPEFKPHGGYYRKPLVIKLRASRIRRCKHGGRRVYTRFTVQEEKKPGGRFGKWWAWDANMCNGY
jgi:hypothetical protein